MSSVPLVSFILRAGLSLVFLYAAVASLLEPTSWIGFMPGFIRASGFAGALLRIFSFWEIALALWLLSNRAVFFAALAASATLVAITVVNITALDIVFRDVAILFMALALAVLTKPASNR
mgnify:CR=1 FL=1